MTRKQKGIICLIISALLFAMMNFLAKLSGDLPSIQKAFFRNSVASIFSLVILIRTKTGFVFNKKNLPFLIMRVVFGTIGIVCNFYAIEHLYLSDASTLAKLAPFFVVIFSFLFLKEKIKPYQALSVMGAFSASLLIVKPGFSAESGHLFAALLACLGAMGAGAAYTCIRYLSMKKEKGAFIVFFFSTFSCLLMLPFAVVNFCPMSLRQILILFAASSVGAGGQFAVTAAYSFAPGKEISVYDYFQVIFASLLGFAFLGELPDIYSITGYILIFSISLFMFLHKEKES